MALDSESAGRQGRPAASEGINPILGVAAATTVVFIWSGWLIVTKVGAESALTIFDIAALRFGLSGLISLPFVVRFTAWRGLPLRRLAVLATLAGVPYVLLSYTAFTFAPAAYGGVFMNGILPALTLALAWLWLKERPRGAQLGGAALIIAGAGLAAWEAGAEPTSGAWVGALLFVVAAMSFGVYLVLNRMWQVTALQVLFSLSVVSGAIYVPIWYLFLPNNLAHSAASEIMLQGGYQILPNLVGLNLLAFAVRNVGASTTAAIMSAVPSLAAILGLLILGERLGGLTWAGIVVLSMGILLTAVRPRKRGQGQSVAGERMNAGGRGE